MTHYSGPPAHPSSAQSPWRAREEVALTLAAKPFYMYLLIHCIRKSSHCNCIFPYLANRDCMYDYKVETIYRLYVYHSIPSLSILCRHHWVCFFWSNSLIGTVDWVLNGFLIFISRKFRRRRPSLLFNDESTAKCELDMNDSHVKNEQWKQLMVLFHLIADGALAWLPTS